MIIQALPLGYVGIANPAWESTQQALGYAVVGSIGIDTGAGLLALTQYLATSAILVVTMAVTLNRSRADRVLLALLASSTIICLPIAETLSRLDIPAGTLFDDLQAVRNVGAIGVLLAITTGIRAFERRQTSRAFSKSNYILSLGSGIVSLAVCGSALAMHWTANLGFSLLLAVTVLLAMTLIRRFEIGDWGTAAIAAIVITTSVAAIWIQNGGRPLDLMLAYSDNDTLVSNTKRVLADAPWSGSGGRSFETLANIYREPGDPPGPAIASNAAAKVAIELGRPMLWLAVVLTLFTIAALLKGALRRGREFILPRFGRILPCFASDQGVWRCRYFCSGRFDHRRRHGRFITRPAPRSNHCLAVQRFHAASSTVFQAQEGAAASPQRRLFLTATPRI